MNASEPHPVANAESAQIHAAPTGDDTLTALETLTPREVAALFRVACTTAARWAANGRLTSFRTPGGHRRFLKAQVDALLHANTSAPANHR